MQTLLTGNDVAKILNVSRSQAFTLMQRGDIPTIRIGRKNVRVRVEDLEWYIEENRTFGDLSAQNVQFAAKTLNVTNKLTNSLRGTLTHE